MEEISTVREVIGPVCNLGVVFTDRAIMPLVADRARSRPIAYAEIRWVGPVEEKRLSALVLAVPSLVVGLATLGVGLHDGWGMPALVVGVGMIAFGLNALYSFIRGRQYLGIATDFQVIRCLPMNSEPEISRALTLLKRYCPDDLRWDEGLPIPMK